MDIESGAVGNKHVLFRFPKSFTNIKKDESEWAEKYGTNFEKRKVYLFLHRGKWCVITPEMNNKMMNPRICTQFFL